MIDSAGIYRKANNLVQAHGSRNAIEIARSSGIIVHYVDYFKDLLGLYLYKLETASIFLNNKLDEYMVQVVGAHELGHDQLHRDIAENGFQEFELFRMSNSTEYEANAFAAHLLIDTDECMDIVRNGYDVVTAAKMMNTEINLLLIKLQELQRLGYDSRMPMAPHGDFLKNIRI